MRVEVGDKVFVTKEKRPYRVRVRDDRYIICTKPFNPKHTVQYFIIDLERKMRGPDNMVFCSGYETNEECEERLKEKLKIDNNCFLGLFFKAYNIEI